MGVPQTHHVFWMGDLNYRLEPFLFGLPGLEKPKDGKLPKSGTEEHKVVWNKLTQMIKEKQWDELIKLDEMKEELKCKRMLSGFEEGDYNFEPTFKVLTRKKMEKEGVPPDQDLAYTAQRWPAYCDRVLWHSHPTRLGDVTQTNLTNLKEVVTSDHKPVKSDFKV